MSQRTVRPVKRASLGSSARPPRPVLAEPLERRALLDGQSLPISQLGQWGGLAHAVEVVGTTGYLPQGSNLVVLDLSDPAHPQELGRAALPDRAIGVSVAGNYAYVADDVSGLQIIDVSNPAAPTLVGGCDTPGMAIAVSVVGNYAYVADSSRGLQVLNIANPAAPTLVGTYDTPGDVMGVDVVGSYAYLADGFSGLQVLNISNPATPTLVGSYNTPSYAMGVSVAGNYAYVADQQWSLQILNISNPTAPTLTGTYNTPGYAYGVSVAGNYAYVAEYTSGLQILNISNPAAPTLAGSYDTPGGAWGVSVVGDLVYVADYTSGLAILRVQYPPTDIQLSTATITENLPAGSLVGQFSAVDLNSPDSFSYTLVSGAGNAGNASFSVAGNQLRSAAAFDFEAQSSYSIRVRVTDQTGFSFEKVLTIAITNVNEAPTDLVLGNRTVAENQPLGTVVGNLSASDPDAGDTLTYSLVSGTGADENASFSIVGEQLLTNASFDYETQSSYSIRLRVTDADGLFFDKVFTISVSDANDTPSDIALSNASVAENQPGGTAIGAFSASDPDAGETLTYTLISGTGDSDNASFTIAGDQLQTSASFDHETKSSYSIRVRVTDAGGLWFEKTFPIGITDANETPTDISLDSATVAENQPLGTAVGMLLGADPDADETFTYALAGGSGDTDNASFEIVDNQLRTSASFDYEAKSSYSIRVRVTDAGGLFFEKVFAVNVTNVNEAPTDVALSNSVREGQPVGSTVGTLSAGDPDASATLTYAMVDGTGADDNGAFSISGDQLVTNESFDYEARSSYTIRVRATDQAGLWYEKALTISIVDVDDRTPLSLTGTAGDDQISVTVEGSRYAISLNGAVSYYWIGHVASLSIATLDGNDAVTINSGVLACTIDGGLGNDWLLGGEGADFLRGDAGADTLLGGAGNDTLMGNTGDDRLHGQEGADLLQAGLGYDSVVGGLGNDSLYAGDQMDSVYGDEGDDYIEGRGKADTIYGGAGNDTIYGGAGNDRIYGDDGNDWIDIGRASVFTDLVNGGAGSDTVLADANDFLGLDIESPLLA